MSSSSTNNGEISGWHYLTRQPLRVRWTNGIISSVETAATQPPRENWIAPTLFDLQINGYAGVDFQQDEINPDDLLRAVRALRADGCARFLLTLITDEWSALTSRLRRLRALRSQSEELLAAIVGWHVEGPFLSSEPGFHGAHNPALMLEPTPEHILELRSLTGNDPLLLTVSPERPGVLKAIELGVSRGMKISAGHTNAPAGTLEAAVRAGATGFTHLGNGCPRELDRHDNILWRVLETPGLTVSLIPDQVHVSPPLFRLLHRALPADAIYYITDAMAAASAPPGRYSIGKLEVEVGADQIVRQPGKPLFAGSALKPIDGIFRAAKMLQCPWQECWRRFAERPAALMNLRNEIVVGQPADFFLLRTSGNQLLELRACGVC